MFSPSAWRFPPYADVTIKQTTGGKGMGMCGQCHRDDLHQGQQDAGGPRSSGDRSRRPSSTSTRRRCTSSIRRRRKPTCGTWRAFAAQMGQSVDVSNMKASVKPNGQTKPFGAPDGERLRHGGVGAGGDGRQQGPRDDRDADRAGVDRQGRARRRRLRPASTRPPQKRASIFSDPRAAKGQPGQAKAMAEMYKQFAEIGGIAYETTCRSSWGWRAAAGPMARHPREDGQHRIHETVVESVRDRPVGRRPVRAARRV